MRIAENDPIELKYKRCISPTYMIRSKKNRLNGFSAIDCSILGRLSGESFLIQLFE